MALLLVSGQVFAGDYEIVAPLSRGGMGSVYVATQRSTSERRALKLMHEGLARDDKSRARFDREAKIASSIPSLHVVRVIQAGVDEATGTPWLAMELLDGEDLAAFAERQGAVSPAIVATLFVQLGHALERAHAMGLVHRDLKPENVFLAVPQTPGAPFTAKILDFGIATPTAATGDTQAIGSPQWMAPEQASGGAITPGTDVWSLGLIAFRLLVGASYWRAASEGWSMPRLLREILDLELPRASARAAELGNFTALPDGFDAWFARCVARDPSARFAEAGACRDALLHVLGAPAIITQDGAVSIVPARSGAVEGGAATALQGTRSLTSMQSGRSRIALAIGGALVAIVAGTVAILLSKPAPRTAAPSTSRRGIAPPDGCAVSHRCPDPMHQVCTPFYDRCDPSRAGADIHVAYDGAPHRWDGVARSAMVTHSAAKVGTLISFSFGPDPAKGYSMLNISLPPHPAVGKLEIGRASTAVTLSESGGPSARYQGNYPVKGQIEITSIDDAFGGHIEAEIHGELNGGADREPIHGRLDVRFHADYLK